MANTNIRAAAAKGRATLHEQAERRAAALAPIIAEIRAFGATSLQQIADALNARGIPAARGGSWSKTQVARVLDRMA